MKQADVPSASLDDALRVPSAILDGYAGKPTSPLFVAKALSVDPKGTQLRVLCGAAIAFGLIEGGAQATQITVTDLARRILRPKDETSEIAGKREAVIRPRVFGDFLRNYNGSPFPRLELAINVLEEMGVPRDKAAETYAEIESSAVSVGFLQEIKGKKYVSLDVVSADAGSSPEDEQTADDPSDDAAASTGSPLSMPPGNPPARSAAGLDDERRRRVFITHGKKRDLVEPIRKLLEFGELSAVVSVDRQSVSKPVPEKVMEDMRMCGAAIIHVDAEHVIVDKGGEEHVLLNPNVLIEIGAAMAFYGKRFILLVREGVKLPSNLQGLYEVRYPGETLDATATIKLLEAIKDIKNHPLPSEGGASARAA